MIIPRGGKGLVGLVQREARVPVFAHLEGICHIYVDAAADPDKALRVVLNAKTRRTGICGAAECLLIDRPFHDRHGPVLIEATCNQVNQEGGYTGMTPADFRTYVLGIADAVLSTGRMKKAMREKFGTVEPGVRWYAAMRSFTMRRLRLPKPQVARGERPS